MASISTAIECSVRSEAFGEFKGQKVLKFTLEDTRGRKAAVLSYGGIIQSIWTPDHNGEFADILLGYDDLAGYLKDTSYMGALVGRYANRIANARFELDGETIELPRNDGNNCLHGGPEGATKHVYAAEVLEDEAGEFLRLSHDSPHGHDGFPGNLGIVAEYRWLAGGKFDVRIRAVSDRKTVVSFTLHPYFNLQGPAGGQVGDHEVQIFADKFLPVDGDGIPTGEPISVANTPMDLNELTPIGNALLEAGTQLEKGGGFDHNYCIRGWKGELTQQAWVKEPGSGRTLGVYANSPGIQFYTGNHLDDTTPGKGGRINGFRSGLCLEPQLYPDSPNRPEFPTSILEAGEEYHHQIQFCFGVHP